MPLSTKRERELYQSCSFSLLLLCWSSIKSIQTLFDSTKVHLFFFSTINSTPLNYSFQSKLKQSDTSLYISLVQSLMVGLISSLPVLLLEVMIASVYFKPLGILLYVGCYMLCSYITVINAALMVTE